MGRLGALHEEGEGVHMREIISGIRGGSMNSWWGYIVLHVSGAALVCN